MAEQISDQPEQGEQGKPKKQWLSRKTKFKLLLLIVLIMFIVVGWWYIQQMQVKLGQADSILREYEVLLEEKQRCADLVQRQEGEFGEYEYCTRLLRKF